MDHELRLPSGISIRQLKRDAKKLEKRDGISHTEALNQLAIKHAGEPFDAAVHTARRASRSTAPPRIHIRWLLMIGDPDSARESAAAHLRSRSEILVTECPYEPDALIKTASDLNAWYAKSLGNAYDFGEAQARAKLPLRPPSSIRSHQSELIQFVVGYVQHESGGLAGNKADLFARYGPQLGLPKEPFLEELDDRPEAHRHLDALWR